MNPFQTPKMIDALKEAISNPETAVVIANAECSTQRMRGRKRVSLKVKTDQCIGLDRMQTLLHRDLGVPCHRPWG